MISVSCGHTSSVLVLSILCMGSCRLRTLSWHCPSCLFAELPVTEVIDCDVECFGSSVDKDLLPLTVEVLGEPFRGLRVLHHNVQGLHSKMDELSQWFSSFACKDAVLCFTETWVKPDNPPITIPGFRILLSPFIHRPGECRSTGYLPGP